MFEGFIRNGHSGELALDDIRLGTDIPLENCMGTCCTPLRGREGGAAQAGEPWLASCQWDTSPPAGLPGVSGSQLGLSLPMKEMRVTQPLGHGSSACAGVRGRKHMSLPRKAERAAEGY